MSAAEGYRPRVIDLDGERRAPLARRVPGASGRDAPGTVPAAPAAGEEVLTEVVGALTAGDAPGGDARV